MLAQGRKVNARQTCGSAAWLFRGAARGDGGGIATATEGVGMDARRMLRAAVALALVLPGCDGEGVLVFGPDEEDLAGVWVGVEEITGVDDAVAAPGHGFSFPVALDLEADGDFVLRSFGFPVEEAGEDRVCRGIFQVEGSTMRFFPNDLCRALPLNRYTIGWFAPDGLILEASTLQATGEPGAGVADIRVRIRVERDG
jgi:hypothetical protein